jgi:hypothetical protein
MFRPIMKIMYIELGELPGQEMMVTQLHLFARMKNGTGIKLSNSFAWKFL